MKTQNIELLAAYWTIAGDIYPMGPTEVSPYSFEDRMEAAGNAGFKGIGLVHNGMIDTVDKIGYPAMKAILEKNGIKHVELEFLVDWYHTGERRRQSDKVRQELLEAAKALGARSIKIGPGIGEDTADIDVMVKEFTLLSQQAAEVGANVVLEIMPFSNVRTIETALAIVEGANQPNGGLLLDIWHLQRGGIDFNDITKIPARFIKSIELNDAHKYAIEPLWMDTIHKRVLPGDGTFDIPAFIKAVQAAGYEGPWGLEVLSDTHRMLPLEQMANSAYEKTMSQFGK
ncbi:sugar phosphate isomerase/epimerase family protein [Pseudomonas sp. BE134]|uniref:sugar phosphate isomerase/epimerase family protein n=1 Tax=Pseudomonas sp. BE134 TaxID=2817843 RepID=UPI0028553F70|nr:sugar phosphate isomerase/epimerase family protein [Pseudomonas sp. BE134]MDR6925930.1 sugar phosphate isomerase/epimerase [Pseudomonas sp. BE134]